MRLFQDNIRQASNAARCLALCKAAVFVFSVAGWPEEIALQQVAQEWNRRDGLLPFKTFGDEANLTATIGLTFIQYTASQQVYKLMLPLLCCRRQLLLCCSNAALTGGGASLAD
jgi:hypothetical protein